MPVPEEQPAPPPFDPDPTTAVPGAYIPGRQQGDEEASPPPKARRSLWDRIFRR